MQKKETFTEQTIKRIRSGVPSEARRKKIRRSRLILIFDAVLIVFLLVLFKNSGPQKIHHSEQTSIDGIKMQFSITNEDIDSAYMISIRFTRDHSTPISLKNYFNGLKILIKHDKVIIYERNLFSALPQEKLFQGESRQIIDTIPVAVINRMLKDEKIIVKSPRKSLLDFSTPGIPLKAQILTGEKNSMLAELNFIHRARI